MARGWRIQGGTFGRVTGFPAAGWLVVVYRRARGGGGFLVYPGVREGNGVGTFSRARRWSPPLVRDGEREQCCGGEERGGAAEGGVLVLVAAAGCCDCIVQ